MHEFYYHEAPVAEEHNAGGVTYLHNHGANDWAWILRVAPAKQVITLAVDLSMRQDLFGGSGRVAVATILESILL